MPIVDDAILRVRGQVDPSLGASAAAAGSAYQRLAADVRAASADFKSCLAAYTAPSRKCG